jgi:hypothetical protein
MTGPGGEMRGLPVDTNDPDNEGALLARDTGPYKRNALLSPKVLKHLEALGHKRLLVRSPTVSGAPDGGIYARDAGVREKGGLPGLGENIGLAASQAVSEPLSQAQLCLARGTLVRMADWTVRPIEQLSPGDWIMGADRNGHTFPVQVLQRFDNGVRDCVLSVFREAKLRRFVELYSTADHKILGKTRKWAIPHELVETGLFPVGTTCVGFYAKTLQPNHSREYFKRASQKACGPLPTYDIEVDHPDHLFVLANGLIVSNSEKHKGGVFTGAKQVSGFDAIQQQIQIPKHFQGGATHSTQDGTVEAIEEAPAGGHHITVNGEKHYVVPGAQIHVKKGDPVEAGDIMTDGWPSPAVITEHKGIGEGRKAFLKSYMEANKSAGIKVHRRNAELLARGLINHVRLTDEMGDGVTGDIVPYNTLEHHYEPRMGFLSMHPKAALGKYLERPYLHHTIGTKVRKSMLKDFEDFGVNSVDVHDDPPPFEPVMVRGMANLHYDPDPVVRMFGSGLKGSLLDSAHRGGTIDPLGTSFVPAIADPTMFGRQGKVRPPGPTFKLLEDD